MTPSVRLPWVGASSIGESCLIPPHEIVHVACHRRLGVSGWVCTGSRRDTKRRRALSWAVPEYGQADTLCGIRSVIGFRNVEPPHFVLQRGAFQPETFCSRSRARDSSRRRFQCVDDRLPFHFLESRYRSGISDG